MQHVLLRSPDSELSLRRRLALCVFINEVLRGATVAMRLCFRHADRQTQKGGGSGEHHNGNCLIRLRLAYTIRSLGI